MDGLKAATATPDPSIRRRNSIATSVVIPSKLTLPTNHYHTSSFPHPTTTPSSSSTLSRHSFPTADFELISIKPSSYTSLNDLLPSIGVQSPTPPLSGYEISIRNRLVKQAAWANLQPMSPSPDSVGRRFDHCFSVRLSGNLVKNWVAAFLRFIDRHIFRVVLRAFDWLIKAIRIWSSRYWDW